MTATTVPPMMCAMAAVAVRAHLFHVQAPQLAHPITRPTERSVCQIMRCLEPAATMVTTVLKMMGAMAVVRVQV